MSKNFSDLDVRDAFFDKIYELACQDKNLVFITADADAFSLRKFKKDFPERFVNVGVAEQTMVLLATGLAMCGKNVFIYSIIPFITQRALEHIKVNVCSMNLPVTIVGCGAGLSFGFDGPTHHANQDLSAMRSLPGMKILSPCDARSSAMCAQMSYESNQPTYVRLDKGKFEEIYDENCSLDEGSLRILEGKDCDIIATGYMTTEAIKAAQELTSKGVSTGVIDVCTIKPLSQETIEKIKSGKKVFCLEEHSKIGGLYSAVLESFSDHKIKTDVHSISLPDSQIFKYGSREWLHEMYDIDKDSVVKYILDTVGEI